MRRSRLKDAVNHALERATGYHLERSPAAREPEVAALRRRVRRMRRERDKARQELKELVEARAKRPEFPRDFEPQFCEIIRLVRDYTMTDNQKLHTMLSATRYVVENNIEGDFVECGVWRGGSMHAAARMLAALGDESRDLYLFDTFEGMPPPTEHDSRAGVPAADLLARSPKDKRIWAVATIDDVAAGLATLPYPVERFHLVPGKVEDTIPDKLPERIAVLRLDTDWYASTAHELAYAYDRLVPGGVLMIDDYGDWEGARLATDEFLERTKEPLLLVRMSRGRVAVKPR